LLPTVDTANVYTVVLDAIWFRAVQQWLRQQELQLSRVPDSEPAVYAIRPYRPR
jgi:hypothetical protein